MPMAGAKERAMCPLDPPLWPPAEKSQVSGGSISTRVAPIFEIFAFNRDTPSSCAIGHKTTCAEYFFEKNEFLEATHRGFPQIILFLLFFENYFEFEICY